MTDSTKILFIEFLTRKHNIEAFKCFDYKFQRKFDQLFFKIHHIIKNTDFEKETA